MTYKITSIEELRKDVKKFSLVSTDGQKIDAEAGQFITIDFPLGSTRIKRSYSISEIGANGQDISITVKRVANGFVSRPLIDFAKVGDKIEASEPTGIFTISRLPSDCKHVFFYAAGIGITPIFCIIKNALSTRPDLRIILFYSNKSPEAALYKAELENLALLHPNQLAITWLYSNNKNLALARISIENVEELLQEHVVFETKEIAHYICGPDGYQFLLRTALIKMGYQPQQIRYENFYPRPIPLLDTLGDKVARKIVVMGLNAPNHFLVQPGETILAAGKRANTPLPYSCESGQCGACAMRCIKGKIEMGYNGVLTEKDLEDGYILTCTGHPIGDDVVLAFPTKL